VRQGEARGAGKGFRLALSAGRSGGQNARPFRPPIASPNPLMTDRSPHPHFDDHGTLSWHVRYADALAQAKRENKILFIEMGREL
jgi:hypothetical protein